MKQIPIKQILKSFDGKPSKEEQTVLNDWLSYSDENREQFIELQKTYSAIDKLKIDFNPDAKKALEKINRKIYTRKNLRMIWQAAAAVVILVFATQFILQTNSAKNWQEITAQERRVVYLPDSSKVILSKNAFLQYPSVFSRKTRKVILSGTAYFEVKPNQKQSFKIQTSHTEIEVLGTKFLVEAEKQRFEKVSVDEGKVAFSSGSIFSRQKILLTKNEIGTWNAENQQISEQINMKLNSNAWLSGRLSFSNVSLTAVLKSLENHFNLNITLSDESFADIKYSGDFNTENTEEILKTICLTLNLNYQKDGKNYLIQP